MKKSGSALLLLFLLAGIVWGKSSYVPNRPPLKKKPYSELPLGAIRPKGWLKIQLEIMAKGMTGHLDELYPEVCGERNAWLGGDGDCWERGPYWIDGLYPLSVLLDDPALKAKAKPWIEWTLNNQRPNGQIGPYVIRKEDRKRPPPEGAQVTKPDDWWPRMVMLKILQQHYSATGDRRVIDCMTRYFRYQLEELPKRPLYDPNNPNSGSWWAQQRGGDNLMCIYWLYNITGEKFLLELGDLVYQQTLPFTELFLSREVIRQKRYEGRQAFHCVNLAQGMKTPLIRWQADGDQRHFQAVDAAFEDLHKYHGQPHGLYGADEGMHGRGLTRGCEFCAVVEMLFSLEKMLEISGRLDFADRIEQIAYNMMPTQASDDFMTRQYFQQANQISCTYGDRNFYNDHGDRLVYGLLSGYPCCTCNMHQGWPKLVQHLWMATADDGLAALVYGPSEVTAKVADGQTVTITESTDYPMAEVINLTVKTDQPVKFPLKLRIPAWCDQPTLKVNGKAKKLSAPGSVAVIDRKWENDDTVELVLSAPFRVERWHENSASLYRGPLLFALKMEEEWSETEDPKKPGRIAREVRSPSPWNYALIENHLEHPDKYFQLKRAERVADYFWNLKNAPLKVIATAVRHPEWQPYKQDAGPIPWSPHMKPGGSKQEQIELIPYGCTTLRISAFPTFRIKRKKGAAKQAVYRYAGATASYTCKSDDINAVRMVRRITSSSQKVRRWTSWPQKGKKQWLEIDLGETKELQSVGVYWYNDNRGVRFPASWHVEVFDDGWKTVETRDQPGVRPNCHNTVHPAVPVKTGRVRIVMEPINKDSCVGVLSVKVHTR